MQYQRLNNGYYIERTLIKNILTVRVYAIDCANISNVVVEPIRFFHHDIVLKLQTDTLPDD